MNGLLSSLNGLVLNITVPVTILLCMIMLQMTSLQKLVFKTFKPLCTLPFTDVLQNLDYW